MTRLIPACLALFVTAATPGSPDPLESVKRLAAGLGPAAAGGRPAAEALVGEPLKQEDGTAVFSVWSAKRGWFEALRITRIDYRVPRPGGGATAGPLLVLDIEPSRCLRIGEIRGAFPRTTITEIPRHGLAAESVTLTEAIPAGNLSFAFASREPGCLRRIGISLPKP